jgi:triosephosphate isomerase (TIM)
MRKLLVANWKMNPQSYREAEVIFKGIASASKNSKSTEIVVCPPYPFIPIAKKLKSRKIIVGAQNVAEEPSGAFTGQVSASMLSSLGVKYVIIGHSENRAYGETNQMINRKILMALRSGLHPILCVGESNRDSHGGYLNFIKNQIHECLHNIKKGSVPDIIIAYEPIWAIGEKAEREATVEEFTETKIFIKKVISDMYDSKVAHSLSIIYGGSVHPNNSMDFIKRGEADGFLVGRDSLNPKKFGAILSNI